jgi:hypothetical protein
VAKTKNLKIKANDGLEGLKQDAASIYQFLSPKGCKYLG